MRDRFRVYRLRWAQVGRWRDEIRRHVTMLSVACSIGEHIFSAYSTATITLEALITAKASRPTARSRAWTDALVIIATTSTPAAISRVTSQFTAPSTILVIRPLKTLRALSFIGQAESCASSLRSHDTPTRARCPPYTCEKASFLA